MFHDPRAPATPRYPYSGGAATLDLVDSVTVECVLKISSLSLHMKGAVFWGGFFFWEDVIPLWSGSKKKTCYPRGEFILSRRFKAKTAKGREQSSSVCLGRLLTECLCLNFYPHLFLLLLLLHRWQRRGFGRELLFHSPWKRRNEARVNFNHKSWIPDFSSNLSEE